ncbi:hypothetical protein ACF06X_33470 [Streptomyces sp. NPDC015346]|uniref:hypothetical protein n=1 Tax=Streptomyces sp. NPDC015346 TaxID=3364954 RepID=UPI0036F9C26F
MAHRPLYLTLALVVVGGLAYCVWESIHHRRCAARHRTAQRLTDAAQQRDIAKLRAELAFHADADAVLHEAARIVDTHHHAITSQQEGGTP